MRTILAAFFLVAIACGQTGYHVTQKIPIGGDGGWDYLAVDGDNRRVYVSHGSEVVVLDADTAAITGRITGLNGVHGIAIASRFNKGFISNGQAGNITVFDLKTLKKLGDPAKAGQNPDAIVSDPATGRIFAFNGGSHDVSVLDAELVAAEGTVTLPGKPEYAVADGANAIYVNIEDKNVMLRIDSRKLLVEQSWSIAPCEEPSGLSMDPATRRLFAGCHNKLMAVLDANTGKLVTTLPICSGIDATWFDPGTGLIFNSCGDGFITVVHEDSPTAFHVVETIATQRGSRTMAVDLKTHKLFVPAAEFEEVATDGQTPRRRMMPGTFMLLVLEQ